MRLPQNGIVQMFVTKLYTPLAKVLTIGVTGVFAVHLKQMSSIFIWGYYGTHYLSKILSSFWGIVFYIRKNILLGSTTKKSATQMILQMPRTLTGARCIKLRVGGVHWGNMKNGNYRRYGDCIGVIYGL